VIAGLTLIRDWITPDQESALLAHVGPGGKQGPTTQRNRIERYGHGVPHSGYTEAARFGVDLSPELAALCSRIAADKVIDPAPDAVTIGWYLTGQSIRPHVDSPKAGEVIAVLGLAGAADMRFSRDGIDELGRAEHGVTVRFERRMLVVMAGEARWMWRHEILPVPELRISIVFRRATG
jgi:alkylated DNA repair dioxygenase AlkB